MSTPLHVICGDPAALTEDRPLALTEDGPLALTEDRIKKIRL